MAIFQFEKLIKLSRQKSKSNILNPTYPKNPALPIKLPLSKWAKLKVLNQNIQIWTSKFNFQKSKPKTIFI